MIKKDKDRSEIEEKYKWSLEKMFENDKVWEDEYNTLSVDVDKLLKYKGRIAESAETLYTSLELQDDIERRLTNLYVYAHMRLDEEVSNVYYQNLKGKIENLNTEISEKISFYLPELLESSKELIDKYIDEMEALKKHKWRLEKCFRYKDHTLSDKEEKILSSISKVISVSSTTAGLLRNSDLSFDNIKDEGGNEVKLSNTNFGIYADSKNREVRKAAFTSIYKGYESVKNTLASTLSATVEQHVKISEIRKYDDVLEYALFGNNVDKEIYYNLIDTVNENMRYLHKYYGMKKKKLGLDDFHIYDTYVPLEGTYEKEYDFEEGKQIVIDALSILGDDYVKVLKSAFDDKWIDIYPNKDKRSGAYSYGTYDSYPYILLNYQNKFGDVSTLAHELGHSIHSYYSDKNNHYHDAQYSIFVAEVASTVNELLLDNYLINNSDNPTEKRNILNELMEKFRGTLYRQTMFAEFELDIYNRVQRGEVLTHSLLSELFLKLTTKYYGDSVIIDEFIKHEWARIPHFYYRFYVYQYATGLSAACQIVENILTKGEEYVEKYLEFLKSGGSNYPVELLKIAEVDITDKKVIENALKLFNKYIDEYDKM